jgi:hypothetical protein
MSSFVSLPGGTTVSIPAHQAVSRPRYVPKVSYLPIRSGNSNQAWKASGTYLDYVLPNTIGILNSLRLRFSVNNSGSSLPVPPTCQWIQQIEVYIGTQQVEVLYPNDLLTEVVGFMGTDETNAKNEELAIYDSTNLWGQSVPAGARNYYLPFNNSLTCSRLYVAGVEDEITFRVYFPPDIFPTTFSLTSCVMEIIEDVPADPAETQMLQNAHERGIVYNTVIRQRQQTTVTKADATSDLTIDLTSVSGKSAGLVVYANVAVLPGTGSVNDPTGEGSTVANGVTTPGTILANKLIGYRMPISTLEINDKLGNKRTEQLRGEVQRSFVWWDQVGTEFASNTNYNTHLIPFSTSFKNTVQEGANYGFLEFDGKDRLKITAPFFWTSPNASPNGTESWQITITNYAYNQLVFSGKKLKTIVKG